MGAVFSRQSLLQLAEVLKKAEQSIYIIADEPYRELTYGVEVPFIPAIYDNTVVCYSFSKSLSLPGERIGYIYVPSAADESDALFAAVCGAGRALGYVCAPSLMQRVVAQCLSDTADVSVYERNRSLLYDSLTEMGYTAVRPDGAFYLFVKAPEEDATAFCEAAKQHELLLVPSDDFGCKGWVRIAYCVQTSQIEAALPAFKALYEQYKGGLK
jgi:aspartate aminotransferase